MGCVGQLPSQSDSDARLVTSTGTIPMPASPAWSGIRDTGLTVKGAEGADARADSRWASADPIPRLLPSACRGVASKAASNPSARCRPHQHGHSHERVAACDIATAPRGMKKPLGAVAMSQCGVERRKPLWPQGAQLHCFGLGHVGVPSDAWLRTRVQCSHQFKMIDIGLGSAESIGQGLQPP